MADKLIGGLTATAAVVLTDKVPKEPTAGPPAEYFLISQLKTLLDTIYAPITGGAYVLKAGDTMTGLLTIAQATANTSNLILSGQSLTAANAQSLLSMIATWNTSGNPVALRLAITNTASGATSKFLEFLAGAGGATSIFAVDKAGVITLGPANPWVITPEAASGNYLLFRSPAWSAVGGVLFTEAGANIRVNSLWSIGFGSTTDVVTGTLDTAIKRNAAGIMEVNNGTGGTFADLWGRILRTATAFTVATLPAAGTAGRRAYVTNALTPAYGAAVVGGGAVVSPVFDTGAAWVVG